MAGAAMDRAGSAGADAVPLRGASVSGYSSLGEALRALWTDARGLAREHAILLVLEAQRAGMHLAYMLAAVLVASVLVVTAWLAIVVAIIVWLVSEEVPWPGVLLIAAFLNLMAAALVAWWARQQVGEKPFSATLRQLSADRHELTVTGNHAHTSRP
jgi:uncharacterized membrane protein YqjE